MAFASTDDLGEFLGETLTGARLIQAEIFLEIVSAGIRGWTRQDIDLVEDDVVVLAATGDWELELPQRPVVDVASVTVGATVLAAGSGYRLAGDKLYRTSGGWVGGPDGLITVEYTHGYETIPRDIWGVTLQQAAQMLENPLGYASEGIGTYNVTYADNADEPGGPMFGLSRYRCRAASVPMHRERPLSWPVANG